MREWLSEEIQFMELFNTGYMYLNLLEKSGHRNVWNVLTMN